MGVTRSKRGIARTASNGKTRRRIALMTSSRRPCCTCPSICRLVTLSCAGAGLAAPTRKATSWVGGTSPLRSRCSLIARTSSSARPKSAVLEDHQAWFDLGDFVDVALALFYLSFLASVRTFSFLHLYTCALRRPCRGTASSAHFNVDVFHWHPSGASSNCLAIRCQWKPAGTMPLW